ncbi:oxygenase MpaB family protein [Azospirillum sp. B4]|uniref:oxygenase MpaB family protein n=1 Tax=Azospirillum sp. B4 TaxID=95605 RepID=UPI000347C79C|nr:oxygenase MpaB family protein [Azospirillum sp. B4]
MTSDAPNPGEGAVQRWSDAFLDRMKQTADPEVDGIMRAYFESFPTPEAGHMALIRLKKTYLDGWDSPMPDDLPAAIRTFMDTPVRYPDWVDSRRLDVASALFEAYGPVTVLVVVLRSWNFFITNPGGAHAFWTAQIFNPVNVSQQLRTLPSFILNFTLEGRLMQTLSTWPPYGNAEGLPPDVSIHKGRGIITVQKLRLAHAVQRILLTMRQPRDDTRWDFARYGQPINQEALCQAMLHFCFTTIDGLALLGITQSAVEEECTFMAWKTVLFLLGLRPELQPRTVADGRRLLDTLFRRNAAATPQATDLIHQELATVRRLLPWGFGRITTALIRYLLGPEVSAMLGVPRAPILLWLLNATTWLWKGNRLLLSLIYWLSPRIIRTMDSSRRFISA